MKIGIIVYAFMLAEPLERLLGHILTQTDAHLYLFLHSRQRDVVIACESHMAAFQWWPRIHYFPYGWNRGLAKSANEGFIQGYGDGCDVMLTCNDDLLPGPGDIETLAQAAYENRDKYLIEGMGTCGGRAEAIDISCAAVNPIAFQTIGYWDENFFPAYYEDTDWQRRARLAGLQKLTLLSTSIRHTGSGSLSSVPQAVHDEQFTRNQAYYVRKWGGDAGLESFPFPFNDPALGLRIKPSERHAPYPGHNRTDYKELD